MSKSITNPAAAKIARRLEAAMDALKAPADADLKLAFWSLMNACHDTLDSLDGLALPPVSGGSPDDFEELCLEFQADPQGWPDHFDADLDAVFLWTTPQHDGPLPLSVLSADAPAWEPCDQDWSDLMSWDSSPYCEADQVLAHGTC